MSETKIRNNQIMGGLDGWIPVSDIYPFSFTLGSTSGRRSYIDWNDTMDMCSYLQQGMKLSWMQNSTRKYAHIERVEADAGLDHTETTLIGDLVLNTTTYPVTEIKFSMLESPFGLKSREKILFDGTPAASITLSETSANFASLDIWYEGNNDGGIMGIPYYYTKLDMTLPDIAAVAVDLGYMDAAYRIRTSGGIITATGTTLAITGSGSNYSTDTTSVSAVSFSDVQFVPKIKRCVGYRW